MPLLTRLHLRLAFAWLVVGLGLWILLPAIEQFGPLGARLQGTLRPSALHAITVGFLTQVVIGVAWWLLPRPRAGVQVAGPLDHGVLVALNAGLLLRVVGEPWWRSAGPLLGIVTAGAMLQWLAVVGFVIRAWPRIRGK